MKTTRKKINVYFILAGENLFHPKYFNDIRKDLDKDVFRIVGVTIAKDKYPRGFWDFVGKMFNLWGWIGFFEISLLTVFKNVLSIILPKGGYTIRTITAANNISYIESVNINNEEHLNYLKKKNIDIIISSNGQIFKSTLLILPKIGCINRHSALLPKYAGVLPVFWAMLHDEEKFGVTVHHMVEKVDEGKTIVQREIVRNKNYSLFRNYLNAFELSATATIEALNSMKLKEKKEIVKRKKIMYYSFPKAEDIYRFKLHNRAIRISDIACYIRHFLK